MAYHQRQPTKRHTKKLVGFRRFLQHMMIGIIVQCEQISVAPKTFASPSEAKLQLRKQNKSIRTIGATSI